MAAALSLARPLHGHPCRPRNSPAWTRARFFLSCRGHRPAGSSEPEGEGREKREDMGKRQKGWRALLRIYEAAEKAGRGLKESLSPERKGDWKDVLLMSLSFAIYVYISQKLVCAYCAWMSMLNRF